ncbi:hypothetical protein [Sulfitobacter dubius]|uniref:Uncharacterized protein n=1 Tax=Sulfitobacter dubius TaxID=218673 RepID=A0ABY3ZVW8_9RHOB|nr:hypothetical protein [Sulfitobacter dubius]UOA16898.1 hypothetical protein DSM109990_03785 [Sulfitobacter dubius]
MFDFPALLGGHICSPSLNEDAQATITIIGGIVCIGTVLVARRAYHQSFKTTEIDDAHIRQFFKSAPLWRLRALQRTDGKGAKEPKDPYS